MSCHKKQNGLIIALVLLSAMYGCKKVIEVKLNNAEIQTVISGMINNAPGPYKVTISKTSNFYSDNNFPKVSGAFITITGNSIIDTLKESEPGIYVTSKLRGRPGRRYDLYVRAEGKEYTSYSIMPQPVRLDSIDFVEGNNKLLFAVAHFQDPPSISNYYQFIEFANGERFKEGKGVSVYDDRLSNGRYQHHILFNDAKDIIPGTVITVQMNSIDQRVYNYLNEFLMISTGSGSGFSNPSPANPTSNITGGALGYFSAQSISSITVRLPQP